MQKHLNCSWTRINADENEDKMRCQTLLLNGLTLELSNNKKGVGMEKGKHVQPAAWEKGTRNAQKPRRYPV
jgi:hypothetical protein